MYDILRWCNCELSSFHNVSLKPPVVRVETEVLRQCDKMSLYVGIIYRFYIFFEIKSRSLFIFFFIFQYLTPASRFMRRSNVYILHTHDEQYEMSNIVTYISSFFFQVDPVSLTRSICKQARSPVIARRKIWLGRADKNRDISSFVTRAFSRPIHTYYMIRPDC